MAESDFADEVLRAIAVLGVRSGDAEIAIDGMDPLDRPTERGGSITERILALAALGVLEYLAQG